MNDNNRKGFVSMKKMIVMIAGLLGLMLLVGCATENKALGFSNGIQGFELEVMASATTGSLPFPKIWIASDTFSYASAPVVKDGEKTQVVFTMTKRRSFFGSLFGVDDTSCSMVYIGTPNESAEDTVKRINVLTSTLESK